MELRGTYGDPSIHESWEAVYRPDPRQNRLNDRIMDRILRHLDPPPGALFLDAGCGTGDHAIRLAARGYRCVGTDISGHVLGQAEREVARRGLGQRVSFVRQSLGRLAFPDAVFDCIHCRGVLMHIPDWEQALGQLCRVLKPGGRIAILESNRSALETGLVRLARRVTRRRSRLVEGPGGLEFWSERNGNPFLLRIADLVHLSHRLADLGLRVNARFSTEFWDINRFPEGLVRSGAVRFNAAWFALDPAPVLSVGNGLVAERLTAVTAPPPTPNPRVGTDATGAINS